MERNIEDMNILYSTYVSFESSASTIYIYLYVSDQSVYIGSEKPSKQIYFLTFLAFCFSYNVNVKTVFKTYEKVQKFKRLI